MACALGVCALGACHRGETEPIRLPNGELGHLVECEEEADCFRTAGDTCRRGHEIAAARMIMGEGCPNFASGVVYSALGAQPVSRPPSVRGYS